MIRLRVRRGGLRLAMVTMALALGASLMSAAPAQGEGDFLNWYSVVDQDGATLMQVPDTNDSNHYSGGGFELESGNAQFDESGNPTGAAPGFAYEVWSGTPGERVRRWVGPGDTIPLFEFLDRRGCEVEIWFPWVELPDDPDVVTEPIDCWRGFWKDFDPTIDPRFRLTAYPTATDRAGTTYVFLRWETSGGGTTGCEETDPASLVCTLTVTDVDDFHTKLVYCESGVSCFSFNGFFSPVDMTTPNTVKAGRTVPLRFRVTGAAGVPVSDMTHVTLRSSADPCAGAEATGDDVGIEADGDSGLKNLGNGYYLYDWKTSKSYAGSCRTVDLDLGNGVVHTAQFVFR